MSPLSPRHYRRTAVAIVAVAIVIGVSIDLEILRSQSGSTTSLGIVAVGTCTLASQFTGSPSQANEDGDYLVEVNYSESWNLKIQGFTGSVSNPGDLAVNLCTPGTGNAVFAVPDWVSQGRSALCVWADKFESNNQTLAISVSYGVGTSSNSTTAPYGMTTKCLSIAVVP